MSFNTYMKAVLLLFSFGVGLLSYKILAPRKVVEPVVVVSTTPSVAVSATPTRFEHYEIGQCYHRLRGGPCSPNAWENAETRHSYVKILDIGVYRALFEVVWVTCEGKYDGTAQYTISKEEMKYSITDKMESCPDYFQ